MSRMKRLPIILLGLSLIFVPPLYASHNRPGPSQTIPTRTPMPGPSSPTPPPATVAPPGGGDVTQPPPATDTPTPAPAGPTVTASSTFIPADSLTPTAAPCSDAPTIQAQDVTNVRLGPGTDYEIIDELFYREVRLITGRAADAAWWQIGADGGRRGWVADAVVTVQGYTGNVPVAPTPLINGATPTPGTPWNPTPDPRCTVTPTPPATPTGTPTGTPMSNEVALPAQEDATRGTPATPTVRATLAAEPLYPELRQGSYPVATLVAVATPVPGGESGLVGGRAPVGGGSGPAAELPGVSQASATTDLLGVIGLALLGASLPLAIIRRRAIRSGR
jgi:uncharacterized protein YraI